MQEIILEDHSHPLADYNPAPQKTGRLQQTEAKPNQNPSPAQPRRTKRTQPIQYIRIGARARTCWSQHWEPQCYHFFKQLVLLECKRFCLMSFLIYYNLQKFVGFFVLFSLLFALNLLPDHAFTSSAAETNSLFTLSMEILVLHLCLNPAQSFLLQASGFEAV